MAKVYSFVAATYVDLDSGERFLATNEKVKVGTLTPEQSGGVFLSVKSDNVAAMIRAGQLVEIQYPPAG